MRPLIPRWLSRHVLLDLSPLRRSRDYRALISGLAVSTLGTQLTAVAVPYQVYSITHSSLYVGLVSLAQLFPLIFGSLLGGSVVDSMGRRRVLLVVEALAAASSAGLALNSDLGPAPHAPWVSDAFGAGDGEADGAAGAAGVAALEAAIGDALATDGEAAEVNETHGAAEAAEQV